MKILIISSSNLTKQNHTPSIFEVQQAVELQKRGYTVAILAVNYEFTFAGLIKSLLRGKMSYFYAGLERLLHRDEYFELENAVKVLTRFIIPFAPSKKILGYKDLWIDAGYALYKKSNFTPDIVHAHSRFLLGPLLAYKIKANTDIPFVVTEHSSFYALQANRIKHLKNDIVSVFSSADKLIFVSDRLRKDFEAFNGILIQNNVIIPNIFFVAATKLIQRKDTHKFIYTAHLNQGKNHLELLKAFTILKSRFKDVELILIGEGKLKKEIENYIKSKNLENHIFLKGKLDHIEVINQLVNADFYVNASEYETFGVGILEALSFGLPVTTTPCGGIVEFFTSNLGVISKGFTAESIFEALVTIINKRKTYNPIEIADFAKENFSPAVVLPQLEKVYQEVLGIKH
ncbi:MAG: glycosyltransferase family 4 protein [Luteibaculaceae bacterium]